MVDKKKKDEEVMFECCYYERLALQYKEEDEKEGEGEIGEEGEGEKEEEEEGEKEEEGGS